MSPPQSSANTQGRGSRSVEGHDASEVNMDTSRIVEEFEATWRELHAEKCDNLERCESFGGSSYCYCKRPASLAEAISG